MDLNRRSAAIKSRDQRSQLSNINNVGTVNSDQGPQFLNYSTNYSTGFQLDKIDFLQIRRRSIHCNGSLTLYYRLGPVYKCDIDFIFSQEYMYQWKPGLLINLKRVQKAEIINNSTCTGSYYRVVVTLPSRILTRDFNDKRFAKKLRNQVLAYCEEYHMKKEKIRLRKERRIDRQEKELIRNNQNPVLI